MRPSTSTSTYGGCGRPQTTQAFPRLFVAASTILISAFGGGAAGPGVGGGPNSSSSSCGRIGDTTAPTLIRGASHFLLQALPLLQEDPLDMGLPTGLVLLQIRHIPGAHVEVDDLHLLVDVEHRLSDLPLHATLRQRNPNGRYLKGSPRKSRMINGRRVRGPNRRDRPVANSGGSIARRVLDSSRLRIRSARLFPL